MTTAPVPGSPEWNSIVTASKVAAIIGVSPWESPFSMWQKMKGNILTGEQTSVMARGHYLEDGILNWWKDQHEIAEISKQVYVTRVGMPWAGATLDARAAMSNGVNAIVEVKTSTQSDEWGESGTDQIPTQYLMQVYFSLALSGADVAYIAVLGAFLEFKEFIVRPNKEIQDALIAKCKAFFDSLSLDVAPELDDSLATFETLKSLHPDIDKGTVAHIDHEIAKAYLNAVAAEKGIEKLVIGLKSQVLAVAGRANYVEANGIRVARRQPNRSGISLIAIQSKGEEE